MNKFFKVTGHRLSLYSTIETKISASGFFHEFDAFGGRWYSSIRASASVLTKLHFSELNIAVTSLDATPDALKSCERINNKKKPYTAELQDNMINFAEGVAYQGSLYSASPTVDISICYYLISFDIDIGHQISNIHFHILLPQRDTFLSGSQEICASLRSVFTSSLSTLARRVCYCEPFIPSLISGSSP